MKFNITQEELDWLLKNLRFYELTDVEQQKLYESLPTQDGEWFPPDFAVEMIRERFQKTMNISSQILAKMEEQTVRGRINLDIFKALGEIN